MNTSLQNNLKKTYRGFTLVELIVVITILTILASIAFTQLGGYSSSARDSARIENLSNLQKGLTLFQIKSGTYPMPENPVNITASGTVIGYQGFAKDQIAWLAKLSKGGTQDPSDPTILATYSVNTDRSKMQVMAFLEDGSMVTSFIPNIPTAFASTASDYSKRTPITKGDTIWILLGNTGATLNQPVQETGTGVDIVNTSTGYVAYFGNKDTITGTGNILFTSIYNRNSELINNKALASLDSSLVGYWDMETLTGTLLKDWSGKGNDGILVGWLSIGTIEGTKGRATYFNNSGKIRVNNSNSLNITWPITIISSVKTSMNDASWAQIISKESNCASNTRSYVLALYRWVLWQSVGSCSISPAGSMDRDLIYSISDNNWKQSVFVVDGAYWRYYNNAMLQKRVSNPLLPATTTNDLFIWNFTGSIDEVRIYNRALSDSEISALYNATK